MTRGHRPMPEAGAVPRRTALWMTLALPLVAAAACKGKGDAPAQGKGGKGPRGAGSGAAGKGGPRAGGRGGNVKYAVEAYPVESKLIQYQVHAPGTIDAFEHVQITARVSGAVDKVAFSEGQEVKKGDVLVVIDSERYQSALTSALAAREKAIASQKDAEAMVDRRKAASEQHPGLIPGEELSTYETKALTSKADVAVADEAVHAAELNLRDSQVKAPMDVIVQTRTVETGQYVQTGFLMATLLRAEPLLLRFEVAPLDAPRIKPGMIAEVALRETQRTFTAKITLVAGSADDNSHMVPVTAEVKADEHKYWLRPGSFCDVTIDVGGTRETVAIPRSATRATENGFVAYVIDGGVAHERVLSLGENTKDGWVEVRDGLKPGDKLVTRGQEALSEGALVEETAIPAPESSSFVAGSAAPSAPPPDASAGPAASGAPAPAGSSGRRKRSP